MWLLLNTYNVNLNGYWEWYSEYQKDQTNEI